MKIEKKTRKSHYYNEDRFIINKDFIMVIDGATSLEKGSLKPTGGCYLSNKIKKELPRLKGNIVSRLDKISKDMYKELSSTSSISVRSLPSAGLAWVEFNNDEIITHTVGDCEITIITKDNEIIRIVIDDIIKLDDKAIDEMIKISKDKNISIKEARNLVNDTLIKHRMLMNTEDGYSIYCPSDKPDFKYSTNKFKVNEIKEIYLYSDGFSDAFTTLNIYKSHKDMFSKSLDINKVTNKIVQVSFNDPLYNKYPRFKLIDDITVVKIVF